MAKNLKTVVPAKGGGGFVPQSIIIHLQRLVILSVVFIFCGVMVSMGVEKIRLAQATLDTVAQTNQRMDKENRILYHITQALKQDQGAMEQLCRDELGLVRADEIIYLQP
jgi:cell division protein FtsB